MFRNPGLQALTDAFTAHRQCARENEALTSDEGTSDCTCNTSESCMCLSIYVRPKQTKDQTDNEITDAAHWRCNECVSHGLEEEVESRVDEVRDRRHSSAPKMARDLFPAARGGIDPESHSVFNTLILDEDPLDGSRALRKRKTPDDDDDEPRPAIRKRSKPSDGADDDELANEDEVTVAIAGGDGTDDAGSPRSRTGRPQRQVIKNRRKGMRIVSQSDDPRSLVVGIAVTAAQISGVNQRRP